MKKQTLTLLLCFLSFVASAPVLAAEGSDKTPLTPHKAIYKMSLANVKNGSQVREVSGKMLFDWANSCSGWTIQQKLMLQFGYADGESSELSSSILTTESKDGKNFRFTIRRLSDGQETESFRGSAKADGKTGLATYTVPKDKKDVVLPKGALFPTAHTSMILAEAKAGKKLFSSPVFDGSDEEGSTIISTFIGEKQPQANDTDEMKKQKGKDLLQAAAWPVRMAFFKPSEQSGEPDYEMELVLQDNGIARSMRLDYGDFSVVGTLESIEPAQPVDCAPAN